MRRLEKFLIRLLLALSAASAPGVALAEPTSRVDDLYVDSRGLPVRFTPTYEAWFGSDRYQPDYVRAAVEHGIAFAVELGVYWFDPDSNFVDWQYPNLGSKLTSREAFRFDDNLLQTNYLFHPFAGSTHYVISRANGFGIGGALATAATSSALYEMLLEWKEIVSYNDLIVTPFGGMALGEFGYHVGNYLNSEPPGGPRSTWSSSTRGGARDLLGFPRRLHDALDDPEDPQPLATDNLGFSSAYAHRFRVAAGEDIVEDERGEATQLFSLEGDFELTAMPGFLRYGRFHRFFSDGNFTRLFAHLGYASGARDVDIDIASHLFGWYSQAVALGRRGKTGTARETAFYTGLRYVNWRAAEHDDQFGIVHLLAPVHQIWLVEEPFRLRLRGDAAPDFASVQSAAYELFVERYGREGTKSSLYRHSYLHCWGASVGATAELGAGPFELGLRARYGHYESIDGLERMQEQVTRETHGSETIVEVGGHLLVEPPESALLAKIALDRVVRGSKLPGFSETRSRDTFEASLGLRF